MQKTKKKAIIIISAILAFAIIVISITLPCLFTKGLLGTAHPLNKEKDGQIRVACVGDSVTYGYGISNWTKNNYPAQLGKLLGDKYCVNNYGFSGRTAGELGNKPYTEEKLYKQSLDFKPNIVIIMLGSNDTKAANWHGKESYINDYKKIIQSYLDLESVEKVVIMAPPPVFEYKGKAPFGIDNELIKNDLNSAAKTLEREMSLSGIIDLYEMFDGKPELFSDGAHPTKEGAVMIAERVYAEIKLL
ncbi:MAG: hypothetical protein K2J16_02985 [Clostridia bacterium]|nr:hypothetical protein [Clostridia bacterium]